VTSESTSLYDPSWWRPAAYRTLYRQWALPYRIGHTNARVGHRPASASDMIRLLLEHFRGPRIDTRAD
jgi:hypothetical protein